MAGGLDTKSDLVRDASFDDGVLKVEVDGEVDLHNSPRLREDLLRLAKENKPQRVELDLGGVPYMDSSALAVLVELLKSVRNGNGGRDGGSKVKLTNLQPRVGGLLHIARLDAIFDLHEANKSDEAKSDSVDAA